MKAVSDIGLVGLAVMGENLALNMESKGFHVSVYNRTVEKVDHFMEGRGKGLNFYGAHSLEDFIASLKSPRKVFLMVKAGKPVDDFIEKLIPLLDKGDIIIDGGNTHFPDTARRTEYVESKGLLYIGTGVSGGEEGALKGPSMMPGGSPAAWPFVKPIFQGISAKVADGTPCCDWVGQGGAGHFVKMVHNGIEYGDIQLICECYQIMKDILGMTNEEMHETFAEWNKGDLDSYLIEITRDILAKKDEDGRYVLDYILDTAGQKGTGKWMSQLALDLGVPSTLVTEAVYARAISAMKALRVHASKQLSGPKDAKFQGDRDEFIGQVKQALYASKICSYAQGFVQMQAAAKEYGWTLDCGKIALLWRGGCIIRAVFLERIKEAFDADPNLENLLLAPYFKNAVEGAQAAWRNVVKTAVELGIPAPGFTTALTYFDSYRSERLPANLIQAQRDYFGAHTYKRVDKPEDEAFHTDWINVKKS